MVHANIASLAEGQMCAVCWRMKVAPGLVTPSLANLSPRHENLQLKERVDNAWSTGWRVQQMFWGAANTLYRDFGFGKRSHLRLRAARI